MLIYNDLLSGQEVASDSYPVKYLADGAIMVCESKKVQEGGGEINIGQNKSAEEQEEGVEDEVKTVINLVSTHQLVQVKPDLKEYKTLQGQYWKDVLEAINKEKKTLLFGDDAKAPTDKEELKKAETAAVAKLSKYDKAKYDAVVVRFERYKKNFKALQDFVKNEIVANFSDFDFFIAPEPAELGKCMIIPARYVGEAPAPVFYFFVDGLIEEKA
jgi:hypothetical protein